MIRPHFHVLCLKFENSKVENIYRDVKRDVIISDLRYLGNAVNLILILSKLPFLN